MTLSAYPIECQVNLSLNWVLTTGEISAIHADVQALLRDPANVANLSRSRSADVPPEVQQRVDQAKPAAKPGEKPTGADAARTNPTSRSTARHAGTAEAQGQVGDKLGGLKLPNLPPPKPESPPRP